MKTPYTPPAFHSTDRVCSACFEDADLKRYIRDHAGPRGCSFCRRAHAPTIEIGDLVEFIEERMGTFYGRAVDQLPYDSGEGGYQGSWHTDSVDLLFGKIGLSLPRDDDGRLARAISYFLADEEWCEYDWLALNLDESLRSSWEEFCDLVKHHRRYFFHRLGGEEGSSHPDERSMWLLLAQIGELIDKLDLVREEAIGFVLYRARPRSAGVRFKTAADLGPPPADLARQSNRMNPPGIPMFYGSDRRALACAEVRSSLMSVGKFATERPIRLLDLANLPPVPGFFSTADRDTKLSLSFLRPFAEKIAEPVAGDDRTNIEYIPTQVFTEFLRDYAFSGGAIDGIRYRSATGQRGTNVVLFAAQADVHENSAKTNIMPVAATNTARVEEDSFAEVMVGSIRPPGAPWLRLDKVAHLEPFSR